MDESSSETRVRIERSGSETPRACSAAAARASAIVQPRNRSHRPREMRSRCSSVVSGGSSRTRLSTRPVSNTTSRSATDPRFTSSMRAIERPSRLRAERQGRVPGQAREQMGRPAQDLVDVGQGLAEEMDDLAALGVAQADGLRERVDEVAVAGVGGDAAGGRVGLREVAHLLERRQLVADGGGRDAQPDDLRDGLAADRLTRPDVLVDQGAQDAALALGQAAGRRGFGGRGGLRLGRLGGHGVCSLPADSGSFSSLSDRVLALPLPTGAGGRWLRRAWSAAELEHQLVGEQHAAVGERDAAGAARGEALRHEVVGARRAPDPLLGHSLGHA